MKSKLGRLVLPTLIIFLLLEVAVFAFLVGSIWQASQYRQYHPMPTPVPPGEVVAWQLEEPRYGGVFCGILGVMNETEEKVLQELEACKAEVKKLVKEVVGVDPLLEVLPIAGRILLMTAPESLKGGSGVYDWGNDDKKRAGWEGQLLTVPGGLRETVADWFVGERLVKEDSVEVWRTAAGKMFDALEASEKRVTRMENVRVWYFAVDDQSYAAMTAEVVVGSKRYRKIMLEKVVEGEKGARTTEKKYRGPLVFQKGVGVGVTPMAKNLGRAVEGVAVANPLSGGTPGLGKRR